MDGDKLKGEVWLDEEALIARNSEVLDYINSGRPLDVSIGVYSDEDPTAGEWNGEQYTAIARNHRPDHLALLPGEQGACSWADGCGIRNNQKKGVDVKTKTYEVLTILLTNQTDYSELQNAIQNKLDSMDSGNEFHYLRALYDNEFVYEVKSHNGSTFYKRSYTIAGDGSVSFSENKETVRRKVEFVATNADGSEKTTIDNSDLKIKKEVKSMSKVDKPCCPDKVDALIANEATKFTEDDKESLLTMSQDLLDKLEPEEKKEPEVVTPQVNAETAKEALKGTIDNSEDLLPLLSEDMQEQVESGIKLHKENRENLIQSIQENSAEGTWTEEDLKAMNTEMLTKVYKSVNGVDYTALGNIEPKVTVNKSQDEVMMPTGMEEVEKSN